jgi:predicted RNase H-like HicB family nuclease
MLVTYPAIFHEEEPGYWVEFPEFNGGTQGDSLEEAIEMAKEMLAGQTSVLLDEGKELPTPSDIRQLKAEDGFATLIQADPTPFLENTKTVRKNVTVPEWLVMRAEQAHVNYSETLTEALYQKLYNGMY